MASFITPRVNATYLDEFKTKNVRIVGQVTQVHGDNVVIDANGQVQLNLSPAVGELKVGQFCEIIGTVQNDLSIHVSGVQDFGDNVDLAVFNSLAKYSNKYHDLFYDPNTL
ncbi:conserved hypothetical protein. Putative replication factor-A protein 3 [Geotrichum candidum]|uniref:Replication factor A protein 3 n=1 Tax=Geotrichum candidum TaxID=1173061 RepID=A0A0J9X8W1_GEOCN|nr:conserved hypothetical protein. Putative replication factor-A protein 3 [Geotrichum candidum]